MYGEIINDKLCEITRDLNKRLQGSIEGAVSPHGYVEFTIRSEILPPWHCGLSLSQFVNLPVETSVEIIVAKFRKFIDDHFVKG